MPTFSGKSISMRVATAVMAIWVLACVCPLVAQPKSGLENIDAQIAAFRYEQALALLESHPDSQHFEVLSRKASTHNFLGMDYLSEQRESEAEYQFESGLKAARRLVEAFDEEAESHFLYAGLLGNLALMKGGRGKVKIGREVETASQAAIRLDSTHVGAHVVLGVFYREAASLSWLERTAARVLFGGLPGATLEESIASLNLAARLDPESAFASYEKARTLIALRQEQTAEAELERLLQLEPESSQDVRNQEAAESLLKALGDP
jgi:tetratricopeptide (TPR) repeat protein